MNQSDECVVEADDDDDGTGGASTGDCSARRLLVGCIGAGWRHKLDSSRYRCLSLRAV